MSSLARTAMRILLVLLDLVTGAPWLHNTRPAFLLLLEAEISSISPVCSQVICATPLHPFYLNTIGRSKQAVFLFRNSGFPLKIIPPNRILFFFFLASFSGDFHMTTLSIASVFLLLRGKQTLSCSQVSTGSHILSFFAGKELHTRLVHFPFRSLVYLLGLICH